APRPSLGRGGLLLVLVGVHRDPVTAAALLDVGCGRFVRALEAVDPKDALDALGSLPTRYHRDHAVRAKRQFIPCCAHSLGHPLPDAPAAWDSHRAPAVRYRVRSEADCLSDSVTSVVTELASCPGDEFVCHVIVPAVTGHVLVFV